MDISKQEEACLNHKARVKCFLKELNKARNHDQVEKSWHGFKIKTKRLKIIVNPWNVRNNNKKWTT